MKCCYIFMIKRLKLVWFKKRIYFIYYFVYGKKQVSIIGIRRTVCNKIIYKLKIMNGI